MPHKDPERKNYFKERYRKEHPNAKRHESFYEFDTHYQLAIHSGIQSNHEWRECCKIGLMPNGIHSRPDRVFRRK